MSEEPQSLSSIFLAITRLSDKVDNFMTTSQERQDRHDKRLTRHSSELYGDGNDESPGMKTKVDRLVQFSRTITWVLAAIVTALIGILGNSFVHLLTH